MNDNFCREIKNAPTSKINANKGAQEHGTTLIGSHPLTRETQLSWTSKVSFKFL